MSPRLSLRLRLLPASLIIALAACATDEPWTFALSRSFYDQGAEIGGIGDCGDAEAAIFLLALPLVLDVVFLPVSLTRDLIVLD